MFLDRRRGHAQVVSDRPLQHQERLDLPELRKAVRVVGCVQIARVAGGSAVQAALPLAEHFELALPLGHLRLGDALRLGRDCPRSSTPPSTSAATLLEIIIRLLALDNHSQE